MKWMILFFCLICGVLTAQEPWQVLWEIPGVSSPQPAALTAGGPVLFDGDFNFGTTFDLDIDGFPDIVTVGEGGTQLNILFSSTSQSVTLTPDMILNDTIYLVGALPGTGSTSGLKDMIWAQRAGNRVNTILIGIIDLPGEQATMYNPITDPGELLVLSIRDFNNDDLLEILVLDENMNLRLYGPPDD